MRLCQAHCQENKRKVPESPLLTAHRSQRGADCVCNTLVPETGPPFWKPFLLPEILRPRFWGRFLAPFLGPRKRKQELLDGPDGPDFVNLLAPAFLLQCKPPWTHTSIIEGSLEVKLPTIWTDEKQSREEAERRERV